MQDAGVRQMGVVIACVMEAVVEVSSLGEGGETEAG